MQKLSNFGTTTLSVALINGTTLTGQFTDGTVFPALGDFVLLIENEYVVVDAVDPGTGNFTMTARGYGGTTATSHLSGVTCKLVLSQEVLLNYFGERIQVGGYASRPSTARAGWMYYANDINLAWEYDGGNWNLIHPVYVPYANRIDLSSWTGVNLGTSVWTDTNGVLTVTAPQVATAVTDRLYHKAKPSAPFKLNLIAECAAAAENVAEFGFGFYDSVGGKLKFASLAYNNDGQNICMVQHNSTTSWNATPSARVHWGSPIWLQIEDDSTNWIWRYSFNGKVYQDFYTEARNTFLTPNKVCLLIDREENTLPDVEYYQFLAYWET